MAKNNKRDNYYRISLQWIIVVLLAYMTIRMFVDADYIADFEAYCPFGGAMAARSTPAASAAAIATAGCPAPRTACWSTGRPDSPPHSRSWESRIS